VVQRFGGRARFVEENYGSSALAQRFGVTRYPAIFVNDVLVATPNDFGFYGRNEGESGRYAPLKSAASHERFRADLERMITLNLAGHADAARAQAKPASTAEIASLPGFTLTDLHGRPLSRESIAGRPTVVEFWATWCPPCRSTLRWLGDLQRRYGDRVALLAIAVESDSAMVRKVTQELDLPIRTAVARPEVVRAFGDLGAVPTLFVFDRDGRTASVHYGATPTLHADVTESLERMLASAGGK
jgi:thiol-disulfide isomerase/thioredoxin